jgi:hypothetical protein
MCDGKDSGLTISSMTDWTNVPVFGAPPTGAFEIVRPSAYGIIADSQGRRSSRSETRSATLLCSARLAN